MAECGICGKQFDDGDCRKVKYHTINRNGQRKWVMKDMMMCEMCHHRWSNGADESDALKSWDELKK